MATPRFYCPDTVFTLGEKALLPEKARHHAGRVLRMVAGDTALLFDGKGNEALGPIAFEGKDAWIVVNELRKSETESPVDITLVQALVSPEKLDWIVEKAVECGVNRIVVIPAMRSVTKLSGERLTKRLTHFNDVALSAVSQCGRAVVPVVEFMSLEKALALEAQARFILAPGSTDAPKLTELKSVIFAVGPEGGFDEKEIALALEKGWRAALIGPRVLRTETAGIVAATLANAASGDCKFL
ncbi:MAG: 16S rRNA (uracil(1498)-N(3))-methyltransferase [Sutterellaceae bacterium]|nr:16S rRNA (uracil(1498)-N(3))-methyltransferase [Sutterellaceae bacterium]